MAEREKPTIIDNIAYSVGFAAGICSLAAKTKVGRALIDMTPLGDVSTLIAIHQGKGADGKKLQKWEVGLAIASIIAPAKVTNILRVGHLSYEIVRAIDETISNSKHDQVEIAPAANLTANNDLEVNNLDEIKDTSVATAA